MAAQKIHASTQKFTEIVDFVRNIVIMTGGNACLIIELTASNFSLLSKREQDARVYAYAGMLNSLSFPIQILIRNKKIDISAYLKELDGVISKTKNDQLIDYAKTYRDFVQEMITINTVLNKAFYVIIPYSALEAGAAGVMQTQQNNKAQIEAFAKSAQKTLEEKAYILLGQLQRFSMTARILGKEDLIKLFYDIYNQDGRIAADQLELGANQIIITGGEKR